MSVLILYLVISNQLELENARIRTRNLNRDHSVNKKRWEAFALNERTNDKSITGNEGRDTKMQKYVIMDDVKVGYGNRMYTFINSVVVSVLTGSKIIVNWLHIDKYIRLESKKMVFNLPAESFINTTDLKVFEFPSEVNNTWMARKNVSILYQDLPLEYDVYRVTGFGPVFFELVTNPSHFDKLVKGSFVAKQTIENARLAVANNENNNVKIEKLYQIGFEFGGFVLRNFWLSNNELQTKISNFVRKNFTDNYVIGIQMRMEFLSSDDVGYFIDCAESLEMIVERTYGAKKKFKWFLATDSDELYDQFKQKYAGKLLSASGRIAHVMTGDGFERAIIDSELLSKCDDLIITGGSTFGFVAAMRMGRLPMFFNGQRNAKRCERMSFNNYPTRPEGYAVI
jgi:hypothetical protein